MPGIEVITVRDPDGDTDVTVFIDGKAVEFKEYSFDAGAGIEWEDWRENRDYRLESASPTVKERLLEIYKDPPGGEYIDKPAGVGWMD